jgi:hypothetical protein
MIVEKSRINPPVIRPLFPDLPAGPTNGPGGPE